jgi:hypothetical protein
MALCAGATGAELAGGAGAVCAAGGADVLPVLWAEFAGVMFWAAANPIANTPKSVPEIHRFIFSADIALSLNPAQLHHPKGRTFFLK